MKDPDSVYHVGHQKFGMTDKPWSEYMTLVNDVYKRYTEDGKYRISFNSVETRMVMLAAYMDKYGIAKDVEPKPRDMPLIGHYWTEDPSHYISLREKVKNFVAHNVFKETGLSFEAFMQLPRPVCEDILAGLGEIQAQKAKIQADLNATQGIGSLNGQAL